MLCTLALKVSIPVLSVHEMARSLWIAGPIQRAVSLFGPKGPSDVRNYWEHALECPWGKAHPITVGRDLEQLGKCLGIVFHVDGVEVFSNTEFMMWSWSSVHTAGAGDCWDTKFPILCLAHSLFKLDIWGILFTLAAYVKHGS